MIAHLTALLREALTLFFSLWLTLWPALLLGTVGAAILFGVWPALGGILPRSPWKQIPIGLGMGMLLPLSPWTWFPLAWGLLRQPAAQPLALTLLLTAPQGFLWHRPWENFPGAIPYTLALVVLIVVLVGLLSDQEGFYPTPTPTPSLSPADRIQAQLWGPLFHGAMLLAIGCGLSTIYQIALLPRWAIDPTLSVPWQILQAQSQGLAHAPAVTLWGEHLAAYFNQGAVLSGLSWGQSFNLVTWPLWLSLLRPKAFLYLLLLSWQWSSICALLWDFGYR